MFALRSLNKSGDMIFDIAHSCTLVRNVQPDRCTWAGFTWFKRTRILDTGTEYTITMKETLQD